MVSAANEKHCSSAQLNQKVFKCVRMAHAHATSSMSVWWGGLWWQLYAWVTRANNPREIKLSFKPQPLAQYLLLYWAAPAEVGVSTDERRRCGRMKGKVCGKKSRRKIDLSSTDDGELALDLGNTWPVCSPQPVGKLFLIFTWKRSSIYFVSITYGSYKLALQ